MAETTYTGPFRLETCARPNILKLVPYRCARDDYKDDGTNILLDANENSFGPSLPLDSDTSSPAPIDVQFPGLNRYPDPHQIPLKQLFCNLRNADPSPLSAAPPPPITPANLFLGVGSDECIDALLRCFCAPGVSKILTCPPTYGMYTVSATINDLTVVPVPLRLAHPATNNPADTFQLDVPAVMATLAQDKDIKIIYICSPGNPTGTLITPESIKEILNHPTYEGIVVVDEAYIDFSPAGASVAPWCTLYPNLVVMQTLSKAFGLAGIRLGASFTSPAIATLLNSLKAPYSISTPTSILASTALSAQGLSVMNKHAADIKRQRDFLLSELPKIPGIGRLRGGVDGNFLLYEILDAEGRPDNDVAGRVYKALAERMGVVVRFRGAEKGCLGCLRVTVGTEPENLRLLEVLREVIEGVHAGRY
ncbi:pyridoxal phosphate-dependent transferase [Peziza echinospora]|nr:pyridoxal phosphate-dependent transferase [Peziza echinospora]